MYKYLYCINPRSFFGGAERDLAWSNCDFEFCVYVAGWGRVFRREWPFVTIVVVTIYPLPTLSLAGSSRYESSDPQVHDCSWGWGGMGARAAGACLCVGGSLRLQWGSAAVPEAYGYMMETY